MKTHHYPDVATAVAALFDVPHEALWADGDIITVTEPPMIAIMDCATLHSVTEHIPDQDLVFGTNTDLLREQHPLSLAAALELISAEPGTYRCASAFAPTPTRHDRFYQVFVGGGSPHVWHVRYRPLEGPEAFIGWILPSSDLQRHTAVHDDGTLVATRTGDYAASAVRKALIAYDIEQTSIPYLVELVAPVKTGRSSMGLPRQKED